MKYSQLSRDIIDGTIINEKILSLSNKELLDAIDNDNHHLHDVLLMIYLRRLIISQAQYKKLEDKCKADEREYGEYSEVRQYLDDIVVE